MNRKNLKANVGQFNSDVESNQGYVYTSSDHFSAQVANRRLSEAVFNSIQTLGATRCINSIIDVGCGDGSYTAEINRKFPRASVTGYDPATRAIESAKNRFPSVSFFVEDAINPETINKQTFDVAVLRGVLHHTSDPAQVVQQCAKYADHLVIIEPNGWNPILKMIEKFSTYHVAHEERSFTPTLIEKWCRSAGYDVQSRKIVGFVPFFFPKLPARIIHALQPLLEKMPLLPALFGACSVIVCERRNAEQRDMRPLTAKAA